MENLFLKLPDSLREIYHSFIDLLLPPSCPLCRKNLDKYEICNGCLKGFEPVKSPCCTICGIPFISREGADHPCGSCITDKPHFDEAASLYLYGGELAEAIKRLKYSNKTSLASPLAELLCCHSFMASSFDNLVAVPLHKSRLRERGFNQSQLLASSLAEKCSKKRSSFLLERIRDTPPQVGMKRARRLENVKNAFAVRKGASVEGKSILLVDDVYTTGATVMECSRVLKKAGAKEVKVLTLARVVDDY
ncbi:MAG: ComF family protein [Deltaproteobacteria bacterium]|nr:ComF family protein [Deltaproteobacteria bacterium]